VGKISTSSFQASEEREKGKEWKNMENCFYIREIRKEHFLSLIQELFFFAKNKSDEKK